MILISNHINSEKVSAGDLFRAYKEFYKELYTTPKCNFDVFTAELERMIGSEKTPTGTLYDLNKLKLDMDSQKYEKLLKVVQKK